MNKNPKPKDLEIKNIDVRKKMLSFAFDENDAM